MVNKQKEPPALEQKTSNSQNGLSADLISSLNRVLEEIDTESNHAKQQSSAPMSVYQRTMRNGILALLGRISITENQEVWDDAMEYCRSVIESPQDSEERAQAAWNRSCSQLLRLLLSKFGPEIITAARSGCTAFINDNYHGNALGVAHIDKKANAKRYLSQHDTGVAFQPKSSLLTVACFDQVALCCSIAISGWLSPDEAVKYAMISHIAIAEDYHTFTATEHLARTRMVALAIGAAYEAGGQVVNTLVDATALQAVGTGTQSTVQAAMAWRAVGGCTTAYSGHLWGNEVSLEDGLVVPEVMMAIHDILDWRCDAAAENYENGVFAVYAMGAEDPFRTYLEAMLHKASSHPVSGAYAIASIVFLHYTSVRYGSYHYRSSRRWEPCATWEHLVKDITIRSGLRWEPTPPPDSFAAGQSYRDQARQVVDKSQWAAPDSSTLTRRSEEGQFEKYPCAQYAISWFQHLIVTGQIRLFDALVDIETVDSTAEWA